MMITCPRSCSQLDAMVKLECSNQNTIQLTMEMERVKMSIKFTSNPWLKWMSIQIGSIN